MSRLTESLESERRIVIDWLEGYAPVQAEGTIDGRRFYFRARYEHWTLAVAKEGITSAYDVWGKNWQESMCWDYGEEWGGLPHAASFMDSADALEMISKGAELFRKWRTALPIEPPEND